MAGPHPVVGIAAKFSDGRRGRTHQPHIAVNDVNQHIIFVAFKIGFDDHIVFPVLRIGLFQPADNGLYDGTALFATHRIGKKRNNTVGNIGHSDQNRGGQVFVGQFFFFAHGPKAVFQVVVFHRAVLLYRFETAMVIGKKQALVGYYFGSAEKSLRVRAVGESGNGIFQARMVYTINLFGGEF